MFFDQAKIFVSAGKGGNGTISFRREKYVAMGGPDGGNGGDGGTVYLVATPHHNTLVAFKKRSHLAAEDGAHGGKKNMHGRYGQDLLIEVPLGTVVYDADTGELIADLTKDQERVAVARGGRGGRGNATFATSTNQAPRMATKGEPGESMWLRLELKLIADVGIVGLPNAGKSTLLAAISAARPRIADYPFTTLEPNLGVVNLDDRSFVVADVPGLIEGAHDGAGLGHEFLRHVERTRVLIHLLDGSSTHPVQDMDQINTELELFNPKLARKAQVVVYNKMDLTEAREQWPAVQAQLQARGLEALAISAVTGEGTREVLWRVVQMLDNLPPEPVAEAPVKVFRPAPVDAPEYTITREHDGFRVSGEKIEHAAARMVWESYEAVGRFQAIMKRMGIYQALEAAGIQVGETVYVGDIELEWA